MAEIVYRKEPTQADIDAAQKGWEKVKALFQQKKYQMLILDELCIALYYKLIDINEVIEQLKNADEKTENYYHRQERA